MKLFPVFSFFFLAFTLVTASTSLAQTPEPAYTLQTLEMPAGLVGENGGLAFTPSGKLAACWHHGEVTLYDPAEKKWSTFARGLHNPLGIHAVSDREIIVLQRPELTRLTDRDGNGTADDYATLSDDFGLTGNYHEFSFGPAADATGNLYIAHGLASGAGGATYQYEVRGLFNPISSGGSKFAAVPWRGWVCTIAPNGVMTPFASGFREPNGLGFDAAGRLWVADNQGDWVGTSKLFHVEQDQFYGHPSSLAWKNDLKLKEDPIRLPVEKLEAMRTRAAVLLPHGTLANSPTQPLADLTGGQFGPFAGQLLIGEMNAPRLIRIMTEEVRGRMQGAAVVFYEGEGLRPGNNRLAFGPDGSLWIGQTERRGKWVGAAGIQVLRWTGRLPAEISAVHARRTGFELQFTWPVAAASAENIRVKRYRYAYHIQYGSDPLDRADVPVESAELSDDGRTLSFTLKEMVEGFVHEIDVSALKTTSGRKIAHPVLYYTLNQVP